VPDRFRELLASTDLLTALVAATTEDAADPDGVVVATAKRLAPFSPGGVLGAAIRESNGAYVLAREGGPASAGVVVAPPGDEAATVLDRGLVASIGPGGGRAAADEAAATRRAKLVAFPVLRRGRTCGALVALDVVAPEVRAPFIAAFEAAAKLAGARSSAEADRLEQDARFRALAEAEKLAALGTLVAGVVHELGGPLQSVISLADVLERDPDRDDRLESARRILRSALRCKQIAQDLLAFARRNPARVRRVDPRAAVLDALELDRFADVGDVEFRFDDAATLPEVVCDPQRLSQITLNLLSNARAAVASTGGRGVVRVAVEEIQGEESRIRDARVSKVVRVAVEDRGPGVPEDLREKIFDALVTTKTDGRGTGLGLFVSRRMAEEAGGVLYLDEAYAPGARFVLEIPAAGPDPTPATAVEDDDRRLGLDILVVDDDRDVLETYQVVLALDRHRVVACDRAKAALAVLAERDFDAILCDVRLPDFDGRRFLEELTKLKPALAARVVFATGDLSAEETQRFLSATSQPTLQKPFRIEELESALKAVAPRA
jgi:signal transduction histidine kinase/CheY-like chemotaxis protein